MMLVAFGGISSGMVELSISVQLAAEGKIKVAPGPEPKGVCLAWLRCFWLRWISKVSISVGSDMETLLCMILVNGWCGLESNHFTCWKSRSRFSFFSMVLLSVVV